MDLAFETTNDFRRLAVSTYSVGSGDRESFVGLKVFAVFAGLLIPIVMLIGLWLAVSADHARTDAHKAATQVAAGGTMPSMPGMTMPAGAASAGATATPSY